MGAFGSQFSCPLGMEGGVNGSYFEWHKEKKRRSCIMRTKKKAEPHSFCGSSNSYMRVCVFSNLHQLANMSASCDQFSCSLGMKGIVNGSSLEWNKEKMRQSCIMRTKKSWATLSNANIYSKRLQLTFGANLQTIFTQLVEKSCHFVNLLSLALAKGQTTVIFSQLEISHVV